MLAAFTRLAHDRPAGMPNVVLSLTCDEESTSLGINHFTDSWSDTKSVYRLCPQRPDLAIVAEPTGLDIVVAHRGAVVEEQRHHQRRHRPLLETCLCMSGCAAARRRSEQLYVFTPDHGSAQSPELDHILRGRPVWQGRSLVGETHKRREDGRLQKAVNHSLKPVLQVGLTLEPSL